MIMVLSHANYVEYTTISHHQALVYMYNLDMLDYESVVVKNYSDIGDEFFVTFPELRKRIRFYENVDTNYLDKLSKDDSIMDSLLLELNKIVQR